eukprot:CAMPEP_0202896238 /NCGR_PEP_ID=MMETSP1392-20130828/5271_1 /ASSEMBLY_ACC=CAM_ASM_000868 /TAXON_ID=225041 /ORGANISM="Chlamydomonas chlamydogama, Strain SAG 11-48b" /LENGTH=66 /DNA_ID=CAMNT_0049581507 /DNA_START=222 /DNA_END=419 /DNA_ORIENTATION=-
MLSAAAAAATASAILIVLARCPSELHLDAGVSLQLVKHRPDHLGGPHERIDLEADVLAAQPLRHLQ